MMTFLTKKNLSQLLLGSNFFGTGGGPTFQDKQKVYQEVLSGTRKFPIKQISEFAKNEYLATVYGVGDPSIDVSHLVKAAVKEYEQRTGIHIAGIIPGELGAEDLAFQAGLYTNLPIVDSDLVGGRSAPEIQMDVFSVYQIPITPVLGVSLKSKSMLLTGNFTAQEVEETLRVFFDKDGGAGVLVGYAIQARKYQQVAIQGTIHLAFQVGDFLEQKDLSGLLQLLKGRCITQTRIASVNLQHANGFLQGTITFSGFSLWVKNEHIVLKKGRKVLVAAPEGIVLLDNAMQPIHNSQVHKYKGKEVTIVSFPAFGYWKQKKNQKLWSSAFQN